MDEHRFDTLTRSLASPLSRRGGLRLLAAAGASLLALARGKSEAAAQAWFLTAGEPCRTDDQCRGADAPLVCRDNGFDNDGPLNCCTYEGSRCGADAHCCGTAYCDANGLCTSAFDARGVGDPCQTTEQCRRPQTGAICEYTISTGDNRCCWYEGLCDSGAKCCGSRVCAGGVCQLLAGSSSVGSGTGAACTWEGCDCSWTPSFDPCDRSQGLVCCSYAGSNQGVCLPLNEYCGGGLDSGDECASACGRGACPLCASGTCTAGGYCA